jgi:N-carbamoyl-L-amino-acid hydrolase
MNTATLVKTDTLRIDGRRLMERLEAMARIGWKDNACCRLALTDEDRQGRDQLVAWMKAAGLAVSIDPVGNIFGLRAGTDPSAAPVMTGSHIDTVRTGGKYDGNLGVLGGLEVAMALDDAGVRTRRPLVVAAFSNEEGARFHPDILGSLVFAGGLTLAEADDVVSIDGKRYGDELDRIGYRGDAPIPAFRPHAYVELHIEQGPILDIEGVTIGAVRDLQGISWQEVSIAGQSNHAGTTPMRLRRDAGYCAAAIGMELRAIAKEMGGSQVCTMGAVNLHPNLINVIAARALVTVDIRNTSEQLLQQAEKRFAAFLERLAAEEKVTITAKSVARFEPVKFDDGVADLVARKAKALGYSCRDMTSGAGHDAQMMARMCPTAMIFVPSVKGISHNGAEHTEPKDLEAGANVLLQSLLELAS